MLDQIRDKVLDGKRLDRDEGRWLLAAAPLLEELLAGALASLARVAARPAPREGDCERSRAYSGDEYEGPHGRRV